MLILPAARLLLEVPVEAVEARVLGVRVDLLVEPVARALRQAAEAAAPRGRYTRVVAVLIMAAEVEAATTEVAVDRQTTASPEAEVEGLATLVAAQILRVQSLRQDPPVPAQVQYCHHSRPALHM